MSNLSQYWPVYPVQRAPMLGFFLSVALVAFLAYWLSATVWVPVVLVGLLSGVWCYRRWQHAQTDTPLWLCYQGHTWLLATQNPATADPDTFFQEADIVVIRQLWQTPFFYTLAFIGLDPKVHYPVVVCWRHHHDVQHWWRLALRMRRVQWGHSTPAQPRRRQA